jgi:cyclophilin family peptidyl-prolyl cis-trans isomerase
MKRHLSKNGTAAAKHTRRSKERLRVRTRRASFEGLEDRRLLSSVGLKSISNVTLPAGTAMMVALNGTDPTSGKTVNFGVTTSDPTKVTPTIMPRTNTSVTFNINGLGAMTFQLFDNLTPITASHIEALVTGGFYNGDYIYRSQSNFVVQGGNNPPQINSGAAINTLPSGVPSTINEEFSPDLSYGSVGDLAMARQSTPNTSGTEFFISEGQSSRSALDYSYTLFGFQTVDEAITYNGQSTTVLKAIESMSTETSSGLSYLNTPVKINSATLSTDTQNGVLMLKAPKGVTGSYTVTVTAFDDGTNTATTQTFTVNVVADTVTGAVSNPWASKVPTAPTSIAFQPGTGQGTTSLTSVNNSATTQKLNFLVSGVTVGNTVTVYADGVLIGSATATSTSMVVSTNGSTKLLDGGHTFTAAQTAPNVSASWADSGSSSRTQIANVISLSSPAVQVQVFTSLAVTSTPSSSAKVGQVYTYTVQTNAPSGDTVTVTPGTIPTGMQYNAGTLTFTWTPTGSQANTSPTFSATVADSLSHSVTIGPLTIAVANGVEPTSIPTNSTLGGDVTVFFSGSQVIIYNNIANSVLRSAAFGSSDSVEVDCPAGQANSVLVILPNSGAAIPKEVYVRGASGSTNNQVTVFGTSGANTFTSASGAVTANGLQTTLATVQKLTLAGRGGNDTYTLTSSSMPTWVVDTGGYNTMDFSHDTAGVTVNLGLNQGQAQSIAPWSTSLMIYGTINKLIGSQYADVLAGGAAATTMIRGGGGNDTITGGSGDNVLLGGGGNDTIIGGPGKNLLIGGSGNCSLYDKGTQNIIVAGSTSADSNDQALLNLLADGSRISYGYSARRLLSSSAKSTASSTSSPVSFQDTGAVDTIFGHSLNDWFMLGAHTTVKN